MQKVLLELHASTFYLCLVELDHIRVQLQLQQQPTRDSMISNDMLDNLFIENTVIQLKIKMCKLKSTNRKF